MRHGISSDGRAVFFCRVAARAAIVGHAEMTEAARESADSLAASEGVSLKVLITATKLRFAGSKTPFKASIIELQGK